jgi:CheY-like chemotaxis protein
MTTWKILLAEDDTDDQKLFCDFLAHRTDIVLMPVAENGVVLLEELEKIASDELPHIIILDQNMPKSNGLQTLAAIKEDSRFAHLPVIIYSTYTDDQLIQHSMASGAALVTAKPVSKKGYEQMIDTVLKVVTSRNPFSDQ